MVAAENIIVLIKPVMGTFVNVPLLGHCARPMIGRMYPDAGDPVEKADIQKTISAVANNVPGVLEEMHLTEAEQMATRRRLGIELGAGFLRLDGPLVTRHMTVFATKLGLALYFEAVGRALPATGAVVPFWWRSLHTERLVCLRNVNPRSITFPWSESP